MDECRVTLEDYQELESDELMDEDELAVEEFLVDAFTARSYQVELFEIAKKKNSILVLGTGSGKTFISILLIKELADSIRGKLSEGAKRTVFVVNTVPLVYQQALAIQQHTGLKVGRYEGSMGVDIWTEEKWSLELEKNEVLVIVAQIFCDLVLSNRLPLSRVNLIIMDECHHATGNHPMREIMRNYAECKALKSEVPRIMGLTACVIHKKLKCTEVEKCIVKLEEVMDSALVTSRDQDCVKQHSTKAKELFIKCPTNHQPDSYNFIKEELRKLEHSMSAKTDCYVNFHDKIVMEKVKKSILKPLKGIRNVCEDLGDYILSKAIKLQAEYLLTAESDNLIEQNLLNELGHSLNEIHSRCCSYHTENPSAYLSGKVLRLLEVLGKRKDALVLVFVTLRNTAKLLCSLLLELRNSDPALTDLLPECVVGGTYSTKFDLKVSREEIRKQKETIDRFRTEKCNLIVSTSVLEEGIDIRKCNLVIRFDYPPNYRSYIQSLGRARADPSYFMVMCYEREAEAIEETIQCYRIIRDTLTNLCYDRTLPSMFDVQRNFQDDEIEPAFAPFGMPGPQITFNSAIQLINRYCGTLPQDRFTKLCVTVDKRIVKEQCWVCLTLPVNSPVRLKVTGKPMRNWEDAKKSAALEMCKQLFKCGLLNDFLIPKKAKAQAEENLAKYVKVEDENIPKGEPAAGTKRRRQVYKRKICRSFKGRSNSELYLHLIYFQHIQSRKGGLILDTDGTRTYLGLLTAEKLKCSPFPLYSQKWGEVNVIVESVKKIPYQHELMDRVKVYHKYISEFLLKLNMDIMTFNPDKLGDTVFVVPLTKHKDIDLTQMKTFPENFGRCKALGHQKRRKVQSLYKFEQEKYENRVIFPYYRELEMFYVHEILYTLRPSSPFPESKNKYSSYKDYVKQTYNADVTTDEQPLLDCKHFSKEFNYLPIKEVTAQDRQSQHPKFIPELCVVFPLVTTLWCQMLCMASILHRINGLILEQELYEAVGYRAEKDEEEKFYSLLDYAWCEEAERVVEGSKNDNLALRFHTKTKLTIYSGMILQAFTPLSTKENFNLERLEILGDSYLKYSVGRYVFCEESTHHEGALTILRSQIVSNKTLYMLAKNKDIGTMYQGVLLSSSTAIPYGFEVSQEAEDALKREKVAPQEWATHFKNNHSENAPGREPFEQPYNPWSEHLVPDKCIADSVEALIGVYLMTGGEKAANHFMGWLGLSFITEEVLVPKTALVHEVLKDVETVGTKANSQNRNFVYRSVRQIYKSNCLDRLEQILGYTFNDKTFLIQAVTHPSYTANKITDCYQRLEFLGDAILDYLVTCHIYSSFRNYSPGRLTDLRSHYVKNETLAKIAINFDLHKFILHFSPKLSGTIDEFIRMVKEEEKEFNTEDDTIVAEEVEVPKTLGDVVESLIGAVYIDSGSSLEVTWKLVKYLLASEFEATKEEIPVDCVRELYEREPGVKLVLTSPTEDTPAKCIITMTGYPELTGTGKNKRTAKQSAAKLALLRLNSQPQRASTPNE